MCHELSNRLAWAWARRAARRHVIDVDEPTTSKPAPVCVDPIDYACEQCHPGPHTLDEAIDRYLDAERPIGSRTH